LNLFACCTFSSSAFTFLIEMNFSFKSLFAIWSLSPQRFHCFFFLSIVSWQYQIYSTILILVLCLLYITPLICSSYSSFAPFHLSSKSVSYLHIHLFSNVLHRLASSHQPQTTHVFADSRIALLCHALRIYVAHVPTEFCPFSLLVH